MATTKKDNKARFNNNDAALLRVLRELNKKFADENGEFFQSNSDLRELTGIPTNVQLIRSIRKLVELGVIERKPGKRGEPSTYTLHEEAYVGECQRSGEKTETILKLNDLQEIITKEVEAVCAPLVKQIEELNAILLKMRVGSHSEAEGSPSVAFFVSLRPLDGLVNQTDRNTKN